MELSNVPLLRLALPRLGYLLSAAAVVLHVSAMHSTWGFSLQTAGRALTSLCCASRQTDPAKKQESTPDMTRYLTPDVASGLVGRAIGNNLLGVAVLQDGLLLALASWPSAGLVLGPNAPGTVLCILVASVSLPLLVAWSRVAAFDQACRSAADAAVRLGWAAAPIGASSQASSPDQSAAAVQSSSSANGSLPEALRKVAARKRRTLPKDAADSAVAEPDPVSTATPEVSVRDSSSAESMVKKQVGRVTDLPVALTPELPAVPLLHAMCVYGLCAFSFYATGHASQFSSIDFAAPFVGFD